MYIITCLHDHSTSIIFLSLCRNNLLVIMHIITLLLCTYILLVIMRAWYPSHSARIVSISFCFCMDCRKPQPGRVLKICLADSRSCKNHIHGCNSLHITHTTNKYLSVNLTYIIKMLTSAFPQLSSFPFNPPPMMM